MAAPSRQWGVTPPISTALPTEKELAANALLLEELKRQNNFESKAESDKRVAVLTLLQKITEEFVKQVCLAQGLPESIAKNAGGKIFTYGSYRLGVYGPGSDIDTLVVVPKNVSRDEFFERFPGLLHSMTAPGAVEEMTPVPDAFVPIIKLELSGISIDLIFAKLAVAQVPANLTLDDKNLLRGVDEKCLRCLNGTRVTDEILQLVPEQKTFRTALRGIKLWAQRRAIYANVIGFPGGVAWAMLVARICQLYPHATGAVIIAKFFRILGQWSWPQPILLKTIESGPLNVRVWNPKVYPGDRYHLMPIITPAYPSMCATHNITLSTKAIINREMARAADIADAIVVGDRPWRDLFVKHEFFVKGYKYYLSIIASSRDKEAQLKWSGLVEAKVRLLVSSLETVESIAIAHPFNKGKDRVHENITEEQEQKIIDGLIQYESNTKDVDLGGEMLREAEGTTNGDANGDVKEEDKDEKKDEPRNLYTSTFYIGLELDPQGSKKLDISYQIREFHNTCELWPSYDKDLHYLSIVHTRNFDLPLDLFDADAGETRPVKADKKAKGVKGKKRKAGDSDMPETSSVAVRQKLNGMGNGSENGASADMVAT